MRLPAALLASQGGLLCEARGPPAIKGGQREGKAQRRPGRGGIQRDQGCHVAEARRLETFRRKVTSQDMQRCGAWKVKGQQR